MITLIINIFFPYLSIISFYCQIKKLQNVFNFKFKLENLFFFLILFISIIFILLILKIKVFIFIRIYFFISLIYLFFFIFYEKKLKNALLNDILYFFEGDKFFKLTIFIFLLLASIPINDADSYAYHLAWPNSLINNDNSFFNLLNVEERVVGLGEIINYISLSLFSENFLSIITTIIFIIILKKKTGDDIQLKLLFLSCPIILKYMFSQKPFILPILIFVYALFSFFDKISNKKKITNFDNAYFSSSLIFFANCKYVFIIPAVASYVYILLKLNPKNIIQFITNTLFFFIIIGLPLLIIKYKYFQDPFSPFLEKYFNNNIGILEMKEMYSNWSGFEISNTNNYFLNFFNFAIPKSPYSWSDTFGLCSLIFLFYKIEKKFSYLLLILFFSTLITTYLTNFQGRWFIYIFIFILLIIKSRRFNFTKFNKLVNYYCFVLLSFFLFYTFFILITYLKSGIEPTKEKTIYLYKFLKNYSFQNKDTFIITNLRNNYHFKNFINYRYPDFSLEHLQKNYSNKKISIGIFSGVNDLTELNIKYKIPPICVIKNETITIKVIRRNFLGENFYEKIFIVNFDNNNLFNCLKNNFTKLK